MKKGFKELRQYLNERTYNFLPIGQHNKRIVIILFDDYKKGVWKPMYLDNLYKKPLKELNKKENEEFGLMAKSLIEP